MRKRLLWILLSAACHSSASSSSLTIGSYVLVPRSGLVYAGDTGAIVVSDAPDICGFYQASECSLKAGGGIPDGNMLMLVLGDTATGAHAITAPPQIVWEAPGFRPAPPAGQASFAFVNNSTTPTSNTEVVVYSATSGTVHVGSISSAGAQGTYSVTLNTGLELSGSFLVGGCEHIESVPDFVPVCAESDDGGTTFDTCACEGRTASAACTPVGGTSRDQTCDCQSSIAGASSCMGILGIPCCSLSVKADGGT